MLRSVACYSFSVAIVAVSILTLAGGRDGIAGLPCDLYLQRFDKDNPSPKPGDLTRPICARCYFVKCGVRL